MVERIAKNNHKVYSLGEFDMDPLLNLLNESKFHEPYETLSPEARDIHRALCSVIEELEAVDWYHQRMENATDKGLRDIMKHNRDEEIEHAMMTIEWLRRNIPEFNSYMKKILFKDDDIVDH